MRDLNNIIDQFVLDVPISKIEAFGSGHINDTYRLFSSNSVKPVYVLQKINHYVFPDIEGLSENFERIFKHLSKRENDYLSLKPELTKEGKSWFKSKDGDYWRIFNYINDSKDIDLAENEQQVFEAGKAYGWFLRALSDFPEPPLKDTIIQFHDLSFRLGLLEEAINNDVVSRKESVKEELEFYALRKESLLELYDLVGTDKIPWRNTHNDTKINNVLYNAENKVICVIDLDTCMKGIVHFDYGDALRTIANTAVEDEIDLQKVGFNINYFNAFTKGYLSETNDILTNTELEYLSLAPILMTYIMGIRFLTDYLNGDVYYKTKYKEHNLVRSKVQIELIKSMEAQESQMKTFIQQQKLKS